MEPRDPTPRPKKYAKHLRSFFRELLATLRMMGTVIKWGRIPNEWELDFIAKMKVLQKSGIRFDRVLNVALPKLFGEESEVLTSWIGKKARRSPEKFVRSLSKMWGPSAHSVIISLDKLTDDRSVFEKRVVEPAYKPFLDAINRADQVAMGLAEPDEPQVTSLALYRPELLKPLIQRSERAQSDDPEKLR